MAIRTQTLAEIYVRQGHLKEAIEIYEHLLAEGEDHEARLEFLRQKVVEEGLAAIREARLERLRTLMRRVRKRARSL